MVNLFLPQRVDDTPYVAGEDSSLATEEADPGYIVEEGKPPSKLKLRITHFFTFLVSFILYHASTIFIWFGIVLVVLEKLHTTPHSLPNWEKTK